MTDTSASDEFYQQLLDDGEIGPNATLEPLTGGVSSDIYKVVDGDRIFVVKRALAKLKVADDWHADLSRNGYEVAYLNVVNRILPQAVPKVLFHNSEHGYFAMEHLGDGFRNWKTMLLAGECETDRAKIAGHVLGRIHRETWDDARLRGEFDTTQNFHDLRLDPYLLKTAERHPALARQLQDEAKRVCHTRRCLVHGDFSPKNLLFKGDRLVVLDCEVAWFGDPAFDVAFLLNHLMIKALHVSDRCLEMVRAAWNAYTLEVAASQEVESSLPRLLPALMLARVDGKSPIEYLSEDERSLVRTFACKMIDSPAEDLDALIQAWSERKECNDRDVFSP